MVCTDRCRTGILQAYHAMQYHTMSDCIISDHVISCCYQMISHRVIVSYHMYVRLSVVKSYNPKCLGQHTVSIVVAFLSRLKYDQTVWMTMAHCRQHYVCTCPKTHDLNSGCFPPLLLFMSPSLLPYFDSFYSCSLWYSIIMTGLKMYNVQCTSGKEHLRPFVATELLIRLIQ